MNGKEVSSWLPAARQKLGLTQEQLGGELDVSTNTIARWERGEIMVRHPAMLRLALEAMATRRKGEHG